MKSLLTPVLAFLALSTVHALDLSGPWTVALDPENRGQAEHWFDKSLGTQVLHLPDSLTRAGIGDAVGLKTPWIGDIIDKSFFNEERYAAYRRPGNFKVPFWLQPETYYSGAAWYQRDVDLSQFTQKEISSKELVLERVHWRSSVWLDSSFLGSQDSLSTAHSYALPPGIAPGKHRLTLRIENGLVIDLGVNSHSISDHTQGNWNGVAGAIELRDQPALRREKVRIFPSHDGRSVQVMGESNTDQKSGAAHLSFWIVKEGKVLAKADAVEEPEGRFTCHLSLAEAAEPWDEFSPALYELKALEAGREILKVSFGFRTVTFKGNQWFLNGHPLFLRGTLECAVNPLTGYPATDKASWLTQLSKIKDYGLNHLRFHSWCPPEAAFAAADELGVYFQIEAASWSNQSTEIGSGLPNDAWIETETQRILAAYGNHPSFLLMAYGNEPAGPKHKEWLSGWVERRKSEDPRRVYTAASGWPNLPVNQYHVDPTPRAHQWGEGLKSRLNAAPPETLTDYRTFINERPAPTVSHEIGQWCVYPNFKEIAKYTGPYKARNFEIFRDLAVKNGLGERSEEFLHASGRLQLLCYKEEIEAALRTPHMGGFELLGLQDFPGQGSALVGILDPFWDSKGYATGEEVRRFCSPIVPLLRLPKRVFTTDETVHAVVDVAQYSNRILADAVVKWRAVSSKGKDLAKGVIKREPLGTGLLENVGDLQFPAGLVKDAERIRILVTVESPGHVFENDWDLWIYPATPAPKHSTTLPEPPVFVGLTSEAKEALAAGGTVILCADPTGVTKDDSGREILLGFTPIFWNTAWTNHQAPHTLGISCEADSPALRGFPTGNTTDWNWWYVLHGARPLLLPREFFGKKPLVSIVDDWFAARNLALLAEVRVGPGKAILSGADLTDSSNPVKRELLKALRGYATSDDFQPATQLSPHSIESLLR